MMNKVRRILSAAIKNALCTCSIGASNKLSDMKKTQGWVFFSMFRYNYSSRYIDKYIEEENEGKIKKRKRWEFSSDDPLAARYVDLGYSLINPVLDPLNDGQFSLQEIHKEILLSALLTQVKRTGNCHARCCLMAKYLWENSTPEIQRIEILEFNFDHVVVVVNRSGSLEDPKTWGDALIADPWYLEQGQIYTADEFLKQTRIVCDFIKTEYTEQDKFGFPGRKKILTETDWSNLSWKCYVELLPHSHQYPTYSKDPFYPIEYYYEPAHLYTAEISHHDENLHPLLDNRINHQQKFKDCLKQLNKDSPKEAISDDGLKSKL
jgi:hypothetical protein